MPKLPESLRKVKNTLSDKVEQTKRTAQREIHDTMQGPPSTMEEAKRQVEDFWKDTIRPAFRDQRDEFAQTVRATEQTVKDVFQNDKDASKTASKLKELANKINQTIEKSVSAAFKDFLNKASDLFMSISGTEKDRQKAWDHFKDSATSLKTAIFVSLDKSKQTSRGR